MRHPVRALKTEWQSFKHDPPGERFARERDRMRARGTAVTVAFAGLGVVVFLAGIVMLFVPGPGLLGMLLGLALMGSASKRIADWMDRTEPKLRRRGQAAKAWWRRKRGKPPS